MVQVPGLVFLDRGRPLEPVLSKVIVNFCYVELGLSVETQSTGVAEVEPILI